MHLRDLKVRQLILVALLVQPWSAQAGDRAVAGGAALCTGDCDGNGRVTVDELVVGVNIALGSELLGVCPGFDTSDDQRVEINELVRAVDDALYGCGVTPPTPRPTSTPTQTGTSTRTFSPSRTPTGTPSATATPTPTPTVTAGPPNVAGQWREDQYALTSSTCPAAINNAITSQISQLPPCTYTLTQNGVNVHAVDCGGNAADGVESELGVLDFKGPQISDTEQGCTVVEKPEVVIDASHSPTTAQTTLAFTVSGQCIFVGKCTVVVDSRWTKL